MFMRNIGYSILCGIISLLLVLCTLESQILDEYGHTGYLQLSGAVLFGVIIIIINLKIIIMSTGLKPLSVIIVFLSTILYWIS
jgi:hypothetical protein